MKYTQIFILTLFIMALFGCKAKPGNEEAALFEKEFVYRAADVPFPSCHACTIAETPDGMICAWFGGTHEKHKDVGIWVSRKTDGKWSKPVEVVNGIQNDTLRYPTWNPVLYNSEKELILFYKVGPSPREWWGEMMRSEDHGLTWSESIRLPENIYGPIRNKAVLLKNGRLLCPSSTEHAGWKVHMEWTADMGKTWERTEALNGDSLDAIQPTILLHPGEKIQILCRTRSNRIYSAWSENQGDTWTSLEPISLPNNNSGIDAVTLKDGRHLLVYNHIDRSNSKDKRNYLNLAISNDGVNWEAVAMLENDPNNKNEYSYPAIIQSEDGTVHITYTWRRELISYVTLDPSKISSVPIQNGIWPVSVK